MIGHHFLSKSSSVPVCLGNEDFPRSLANAITPDHMDGCCRALLVEDNHSLYRGHTHWNGLKGGRESKQMSETAHVSSCIHIEASKK